MSKQSNTLGISLMQCLNLKLFYQRWISVNDGDHFGRIVLVIFWLKNNRFNYSFKLTKHVLPNTNLSGSFLQNIFYSNWLKTANVSNWWSRSYQTGIWVNDGDHFCGIFLGDFSGHFDPDCSAANDDHVRRFVNLQFKKFRIE